MLLLPLLALAQAAPTLTAQGRGPAHTLVGAGRPTLRVQVDLAVEQINDRDEDHAEKLHPPVLAFDLQPTEADGCFRVDQLETTDPTNIEGSALGTLAARTAAGSTICWTPEPVWTWPEDAAVDPGAQDELILVGTLLSPVFAIPAEPALRREATWIERETVAQEGVEVDQTTTWQVMRVRRDVAFVNLVVVSTLHDPDDDPIALDVSHAIRAKEAPDTPIQALHDQTTATTRWTAGQAHPSVVDLVHTGHITARLPDDREVTVNTRATVFVRPR